MSMDYNFITDQICLIALTVVNCYVEYWQSRYYDKLKEDVISLYYIIDLEQNKINDNIMYSTHKSPVCKY